MTRKEALKSLKDAGFTDEQIDWIVIALMKEPPKTVINGILQRHFTAVWNEINELWGDEK